MLTLTLTVHLYVIINLIRFTESEDRISIESSLYTQKKILLNSFKGKSLKIEDQYPEKYPLKSVRKSLENQRKSEDFFF